MSFNITCNTVVVNNYQSKPSYRDILVPRSEQPSAAKDHSNGKRSNCISSYAKLNMVSGDCGGQMNGSELKERIERQTGNVPENKVQGGTNKFKPNQGWSN